MKLVRCENGHFYDSEQYTVCPYCSGMDSVGADNVTQPISQRSRMMTSRRKKKTMQAILRLKA